MYEQCWTPAWLGGLLRPGLGNRKDKNCSKNTFLPIFAQLQRAETSFFASILRIWCVLNRAENVAPKQFQLWDILMGHFTPAVRLAPCCPYCKYFRLRCRFRLQAEGPNAWSQKQHLLPTMFAITLNSNPCYVLPSAENFSHHDNVPFFSKYESDPSVL